VSTHGLYLFLHIVILDVKDKHHPRTLYKGEPNSTKSNVQSRRYNIQKTKDSVKRQKSKRQYHGSTEENSKVNLYTMYL